MWMGVFFLMIAGIIGSLYIATKQIDYMWRWYRVPQYFFLEKTFETATTLEGEVQSVTPEGTKTTVVVAGEGEVETLVVDSENLMVSQGDFTSPGDVVAQYKKWQPGILMEGLWLTLKVSLISTVFGVLIGIFGGIARLSDNPALKWSAITYIELIRGSPLLVQIFIWYFVMGTLFNSILMKFEMAAIPPLWYGVAALSTFTGAYVAEIVRAGIQSIHRGQMEAARSLGMSYPQAMRHVIMPQALIRILPPLAGQFISLIKDSSLLGLIAIRDLTKATREVVTSSLQPFELWFVCALLYLVLTFSLSMVVQYIERRTST